MRRSEACSGACGGAGLLRDEAGPRGAGRRQKSVSGSGEAGGMSAPGRHAETAPRHTPGVCGAALPSALLLWLVPREILA